ncbi:MAG TPA: SDR family oxidoreductase [Ktedonobacterales bacterium]|nr:SDR family oxidoreductase [Ktedonobacterales bacterium]
MMNAQMQQPLAGEVAIVTGASSGIGAATARELARQGARVVLAARRVDELDAQVQAIKAAGGEAVAIPTDVADAAQLTRLVEQTIERFGRIDILVNNAGFGRSEMLAETEPAIITQMVNVNLLSAMLLSRAVLPDMLARRHGAIISVASVAGHIAIAPLYSGTKFGLRGFMLALRRELLGSGVSVSVISPGFIHSSPDDGREGLPGPEVIARAIARLARHPRREVVKPYVYYVPLFYHLTIWLEHLVPWLIDFATKPRARKPDAPAEQSG